MKKILVLTFLLAGFAVNAQECIPDPLLFSKKIAACLQHNDKESLIQSAATWKDMEQVYDYLLRESALAPEGSFKKLPSRDSAERDIDKLKKELAYHIDELFSKNEQLNLKWDSSLIKDRRTKIQKTKEIMGDFYYLDGSFNIIHGNSVFGIDYGALLLNGQWRLVDINPDIRVASKNDDYLESGFEPSVTLDTVVTNAELSEIKVDAPPPPPPPPAKKSKASKKEIRKPD